MGKIYRKIRLGQIYSGIIGYMETEHDIYTSWGQKQLSKKTDSNLGTHLEDTYFHRYHKVTSDFMMEHGKILGTEAVITSRSQRKLLNLHHPSRNVGIQRVVT